jgi:voltage-gated potassium channel
MKSIKERVYSILVSTEGRSILDRIIAIGLMLLIILNVFAVVFETVDSLRAEYQDYFLAFEAFSVGVFTVEYLLRLWVAPMDGRYKRPITGRIRYAFTPMAIIDLVAILPALLPFISGVDMRVVRVFRLIRLFRLLKMTRYVQSLNSLGNVVTQKKEVLLVTTAMISFLLLFSGSLMYLVEHEAQPEQFPDIPSSLWWGIATLTTVGYGDIFPITPLGKILGGLIAFLGIGMFALPAGILAGGFAEEVERLQKKKIAQKETCPRCGEPLRPD